MDRERGDNLRDAGRPLKRLASDPLFWAKLAALWHRERVREEYVSAGYAREAARRKANDEALDVARSHGWKGQLGELKDQLAELLVRDLPSLRKRTGRSVQYWEEMVHEDLLFMLRSAPAVLKTELIAYARHEVELRGRFAGATGMYKLAYIIGYVPALEHLARRNAFIEALSEIGHDWSLCDTDLFKVVMRFSRPYTLKPFETRLGFPMPTRDGSRAPRARGLFRSKRAEE